MIDNPQEVVDAAVLLVQALTDYRTRQAEPRAIRRDWALGQLEAATAALRGAMAKHEATQTAWVAGRADTKRLTASRVAVDEAAGLVADMEAGIRAYPIEPVHSVADEEVNTRLVALAMSLRQQYQKVSTLAARGQVIPTWAKDLAPPTVAVIRNLCANLPVDSTALTESAQRVADSILGFYATPA